jgi:hypothetical protein
VRCSPGYGIEVPISTVRKINNITKILLVTTICKQINMADGLQAPPNSNLGKRKSEQIVVERKVAVKAAEQRGQDAQGQILGIKAEFNRVRFKQ